MNTTPTAIDTAAVPFAAKAVPITLLVSAVLTWQLHSRAGNETFKCDGGDVCELGSGLSWLSTGPALIGPFIALLGFSWSRRLHRRARLGPFSYRAIPDSEQMLEVCAVLGAGLLTYWLLANGSMIESVDVGRPNTWLLDVQDITSDEPIDDLVPTRSTWFAIGVVLSAPFAFSFGSMLGREWYGRRRRSAQNLDADTSEVIDLTTIDLTEIERQQKIDDV